jgi:hypothetical protein
MSETTRWSSLQKPWKRKVKKACFSGFSLPPSFFQVFRVPIVGFFSVFMGRLLHFVDFLPHFLGKLLTAFFAYFSLGNRHSTAFAGQFGIGFNQSKPVFTHIPKDFLDIDLSGLGDFRGGGAGAGGKVMKNLQVIIVFFFDTRGAYITASGEKRKNPATTGTIGQAHEKVF